MVHEARHAITHLTFSCKQTRTTVRQDEWKWAHLLRKHQPFRLDYPPPEYPAAAAAAAAAAELAAAAPGAPACGDEKEGTMGGRA